MNLKTKLMSSIATMSLAAALVGGATFAWFTAGASVNDNPFGTANFAVEAGAVAGTNMAFEGLAPGIDPISQDFTVTNIGDLQLKFKLSATDNDAAGSAGAKIFANADAKIVKVTGTTESQVWPASGTAALSTLDGDEIETALDPSATGTYRLYLSLPGSVGNEIDDIDIVDESGSFDLSISATQSIADSTFSY